METNPAQELEEIRRLQSATVIETTKAPRWAMPVYLAALVVFISAFEVIESTPVAVAWAALWTLVLLAWLRWVRNAGRATGNSDALHRSRRVRIAEWVYLFVVGNAIVLFGSRVSWVLVAVLLAVFALTAGGLNWLRWRRHEA